MNARGLLLVGLLLLPVSGLRALPEAADVLTQLARLQARVWELQAGWEHLAEHLDDAEYRLGKGLRNFEALRRRLGPDAVPALFREDLRRGHRRAAESAAAVQDAGKALDTLEERLRWLRGRYPGPGVSRDEARRLKMHLDHVERRLEPVEEVRSEARAGARAVSATLTRLAELE